MIHTENVCKFFIIRKVSIHQLLGRNCDFFCKVKVFILNSTYFFSKKLSEKTTYLQIVMQFYPPPEAYNKLIFCALQSFTFFITICKFFHFIGVRLPLRTFLRTPVIPPRFSNLRPLERTHAEQTKTEREGVSK